MRRILSCLIAMQILASPAFAGVIATPPLDPDASAGEKLACIVANVSAKKTVELTLTIYDFIGNTMAGPLDLALLPLRNTRVEAGASEQGHCIVEVRKGGTRNVRASLTIRTPSGATIAAVAGSSH